MATLVDRLHGLAARGRQSWQTFFFKFPLAPLAPFVHWRIRMYYSIGNTVSDGISAPKRQKNDRLTVKTVKKYKIFTFFRVSDPELVKNEYKLNFFERPQFDSYNCQTAVTGTSLVAELNGENPTRIKPTVPEI